MKTFIPKEHKYRGVQFTGDNRERVAKFLQVEEKYCEIWRNEDTQECHLNVEAPGCNLGVVDTGDWILVNTLRNRFSVHDADELKDHYEELPSERLDGVTGAASPEA